MFSLFLSVGLPTFILLALAGLIAKFVVEHIHYGPEKITWPEYLGVLIVFTLITVLVIQPIGFALSVNAQLQHVEYWNGSLTGSEVQRTECYRDGPCRWEYSCDPYEVCRQVCSSWDKDGNCTEYRQECTTHYRDCPYVDYELTYVLRSELGPFTVAENRLPENPQEHRWREWERIPQSVIDRAGVGPTNEWIYYRDRLESGVYDPVTRQVSERNYILAAGANHFIGTSQVTVDAYRSQGLLPGIATSVRNHFLADKVAFVGFSPEAEFRSVWNQALMRFNAALGPDLDGDLRLVLVQSEVVEQDTLTYMIALRQYWAINFDDYSLPHNTIVVILGTDGQHITWARAFTGMPTGNEAMTNEIERRIRQNAVNGRFLPLQPEVILGSLSRSMQNGALSTQHTQQSGYLEDIIWGISQPHTRFRLEEMESAEGSGGYSWMRWEVDPTAAHKRLMILASFLFSLIGWGVVFVFEVSSWLMGQVDKFRSNFKI